MMEKYQRPPHSGTVREPGREEDQKLFGDRLSKKQGEAGIT
jgi:hypothetical protein